MNKELENLSASLDALGKAILAGTSDDRTFLEMHGWNCPPLNRHQLASLAFNIVSAIKISDSSQIDKAAEANIKNYSQSIVAFQTHTLPYLFNGNAAAAYPIYASLIEYVSRELYPIIGWKVVTDKRLISSAVSRRMEGLSAAIDRHQIEEKAISSKISIINEAAEAAEELPTTLQQLNKAQDEVEKAASKASEIVGKIDSIHSRATSSLQETASHSAEAKKLAEQCSEAYRATTSIGLAAAFDERANKLASSVTYWVGGLVASLIAGGYVGYIRFSKLTESIEAANLKPFLVTVEFLLASFSVALPLWFAWLSTKQIGQRFRLSEDYAYKASVAKAYEGFRREATRFNPEIEERLFRAALTRLEEEPLRYVESTTHGSPLQESGIIDKAIGAVGDVKGELQEAVKSLTSIVKAPADTPPPTKPT